MPFRNLLIQKGAVLRLRQNSLVIEDEETNRVPIEDINSVVIEDPRAMLSVPVLSALAESGVSVFICDSKHIPAAVLLPFASHSRNTETMKAQESLTVPRQKRLWQQIVAAKIRNQAKCLALLDKDEAAKHLEKLAATVVSGDVGNVEATAANFYFKELISKGFTRSDKEDIYNAVLNYGYAIIRGSIARLLAGYGFIPMRGIHHRNNLNSFNLADDFIEPFRPVVDLFAVRNITEENELTPRLKLSIYNLLNVNMLSGGQKHSLAYAAERMVQSFAACCKEKEKQLMIPELLEPEQHSYE